MADIIQLLPDAIANQIAAGEVIQRPASVVKELLENSIDAGGANIKLIIKDAGKSLIQIIDDGCGMSETDARMCFERHATSKIRQAKDLFAIRTMGFRGEAMASIAAIAHVELKTRRQSDELGVRIIVEGSEVKTQEACQCAAGTSISVKNLFYNVPARRNFLKSTSVEMRHILDEFQRVAIAHPDIFFSLHHNTIEIFHLHAGNLRQRIVGIFGSTWNKKLVPINEETDVLKITGFVGKPEFAKKTRGEQLFYVNQRFIKSGYLNHAIMGAYEDILAKDTFPLYVVFLDIDPARIDINVHPTKQEIKFDDERLVYNYLKVAIRHALGQYSITPTLDFDQEINFSTYIPRPTDSTVEQNYTKASSKANDPDNFKKPLTPLENTNLKNWDKLYEGLDEFDQNENTDSEPLTIGSQWSESQDQDNRSDFVKKQKEPYQVHGTYIVNQIKSGFILVDQQAAHERILYERYFKALEQQESFTQKELFPKTITVSTGDAEVLKSIGEQINALGFDLQEFGNNTFVIHGIPADLPAGYDEQRIIEVLLEQYKNNLDLKLGIHDNIARAMAKSASIKRGQQLAAVEMQELIDQLFACEVPYKSPTGRNCFITFELEDLIKQFEG
ncbi:MAG: DNA mismatch repair protein MutL [Saprospiraceae bacterium]|jgi:DNA mismatch repair protein MutL